MTNTSPTESIEEAKNSENDVEEGFDAVKSICGSPFVDLLRDLVSQSQDEAVSRPIAEKEDRTKVHKLIREYFPQLVSETFESCVKVTRKNSNKKQRFDSKAGYTLFHLYKENTDTMEALNLFSKLMKIPVTRFSFAGTKDKRGVTVQQMVAKNVGDRRLAGLNKRLRNMQLGNFKSVNDPLGLGDLKGNLFTVVLKDCKHEEKEKIQSSVYALSKSGFINYYGMQRFGTSSIATFEVGKAMLRQDWILAVDLIMNPRDGDSEELNHAREEWKNSKDAQKCQPLFPRFCSSEHSILKYFATKNINDSAGAIQSIKREMRLMYVHSFQSFIWNLAASARVKLGKQLIVGDLVKKDVVTCVTDENISEYSFTDVVIPLPGSSVVYPEGEFGDIYRKIIDDNCFSMNDSLSNEYNLKGSYRKLICNVEDIQVSFKSYRNPDLRLVPSDLDLLNGIDLEKDNMESDGENLAAILKFSLPSSSYATMCLREIMHNETSSKQQKAL